MAVNLVLHDLRKYRLQKNFKRLNPNFFSGSVNKQTSKGNKSAVYNYLIVGTYY